MEKKVLWFALGVGVSLSTGAAFKAKNVGPAGSYQIACIDNPAHNGLSNCTVLDTRTGKVTWSHTVDYVREEPTDVELKTTERTLKNEGVIK